MELNTRLQILRDAKQISDETFEAMLNVISMFERKWSIRLTEENGAMFITHLSVAVERIIKGDAVAALDENIYKEIRENRNFNKGIEAIKAVEEEIGVKIPENEKNFIMIYLCTLFEKDSGCID